MALHIEVLTPAQQRLLPACSGLAKEWQAYLAGGSALALHLGHRKSDDFDWFTTDHGMYPIHVPDHGRPDPQREEAVMHSWAML